MRITIITQGARIIIIIRIKTKTDTTIGIRIILITKIRTKTITTMIQQEKIREVTAKIGLVTMMREVIIQILVETTRDPGILTTIFPSKMLHQTITTTTTRLLRAIETTGDKSQTYRKKPEIITGSSNSQRMSSSNSRNNQSKNRMKLLANKRTPLKRPHNELM